MSRRGVFHAILALPRTALLFLGLTAVIAGILAMHVWMGSHGATRHHGAGSGISTPEILQEPGHHLAPATVNPSVEHTHASDGGGSGPTAGCAMCCDAGDMAAGMCVLGLIVMTLFGLRLRRTQNALFSVLLRGPPKLNVLRSEPAPTPSLVLLSISRT